MSDDAMDVDVEPAAMSYWQLQAACKEAGLPAKGKTEVLRKLLLDFAKDPSETLKRLGRDKSEKKKENNGWIDWRNSAAREILMEDLEQNGWLYSKDLDADVVYEIYKAKEETFFENLLRRCQVRSVWGKIQRRHLKSCQT